MNENVASELIDQLERTRSEVVNLKYLKPKTQIVKICEIAEEISKLKDKIRDNI